MTELDTRVEALAEVRLVDPELNADPFGYYKELVEHAPVLWNNKQRAWLISNYDDVSAALRDETYGSDRITPYVASHGPAAGQDRSARMFEILSRWIVFLSPPDHTRLRGLVHKSFTPRRIKTLQGKAESLALELAQQVRARLDAGETVDLMADFCMPMPGQMIADMFGVPAEDGIRLKHWAEELGLFINGAKRDDERDARVVEAMADFEEYLLEIIEQYRREPADNILSGLVEANEDDDTLNELELLATCMLILDAGYKTIQNAMANAFMTFINSEEDWNKLRENPSLAGQAIEESLRFAAPGNIIVRRAAKDIELRGKHIKQGDRVYLLTGAANRDPSQFDRPDEFVIDRIQNPHLTFGQGIHFCLGASLARMELVAALKTLVTEIERPEIAVPIDELPWHDVLILRGVNALPVRKRGLAA